MISCRVLKPNDPITKKEPCTVSVAAGHNNITADFAWCTAVGNVMAQHLQKATDWNTLPITDNSVNSDNLEDSVLLISFNVLSCTEHL